MRLIDANALMKTGFNDVVLVDGEVKSVGLILAETVDKATTIDAVEVVRCRECKYRFGNNGYSKNGCPIIDANIWMDDDDFCSYGERKDIDNAT